LTPGDFPEGKGGKKIKRKEEEGEKKSEKGG